MRITASRLVVVIALLVVACAGDGEGSGTTSTAGADTTPTTAATPTTQAAATPNANDDFCEFLVEYADGVAMQTNMVSMTPTQVEDLFRGNLEAITQAAQLAPNELQSDVEMFVVAFGGFVDFLDEYDFDFMALAGVAETDPRLQALEDPALQEAGDRIEAYCGIDGMIASPPSAPSDGGGVTAIPGAELPDDFPAELVPPDGDVVAAVSVGGGASVTFDTATPVDDVIAFYVEVLGPPVQEVAAPKGAFWTGVYEGGSLNLVVAEIGAGQVQVNVTVGG